MDGASELKIFVKIGIPLGKNGIVAALLLQFLEYWNVVEQPMIFLDSKELWPLTLYLPEIGMENAGQAIVAAVITLVPTMILFFMCKDQLEKGIVASAVKRVVRIYLFQWEGGMKIFCSIERKSQYKGEMAGYMCDRI